MAGRDQPGQAHRQPPVPAAPEVRQRAIQRRPHLTRPADSARPAPAPASHHGPGRPAAPPPVPPVRGQGPRGCRNPRAGHAGSRHPQARQQLPSAHLLIPSPGSPATVDEAPRDGTALTAARARPCRGGSSQPQLVRRDRQRPREPPQHPDVRQRRYAPLVPRHLRRRVTRPRPQLSQRQPAATRAARTTSPGRSPPGSNVLPMTPPIVTPRTPSVTFNSSGRPGTRRFRFPCG